MANFPRGALPFYYCNRCWAEVTFAQVEMMGRIEHDVFYCAHTCPCSPGEVFERRFARSDEAIKRLLGKLRPRLPYRAAPGEYQLLPTEHERSLRIFAWECQMLRDVDEFLTFCTRPPLAP